jgi:hypothetical protein
MNPRTRSRRIVRRTAAIELVPLSTVSTMPILAVVQEANPLPVIQFLPKTKTS